MFYIMLYSHGARKYIPTAHGPFETQALAQIYIDGNDGLRTRKPYIAKKRVTIHNEEVFEPCQRKV